MEAALKLSSDPWLDLPARSTVIAHGVRIGLAADAKATLDQLKATLPPGARVARHTGADISYTLSKSRPGPGQPGVEEVIAGIDREELLRSTDAAVVLEAVERHMHLYVAEHAPLRVFVHAGVVGWKGKAIVIPGSTFSGKSTLVAALVQAGGTYYSDEFAVVDPVGHVHPYLQPIQLRDAHGLRDPVAAAKVPVAVVREALTVRLVLVTRYRRSGRWRPRPISPGAGFLALLANTVSARRDPKRALEYLARMLAGASVIKGTRGEASSAVRQLIRSGYLLT